MKKIVSFIIAVILLSSCLGITSLAADLTVTLSEDFQTLYANDTSYSAVDPSYLYTYGEESKKNVKLSPTQEESIKKVDLLSDYDEIAFFADIVYKNGITLSVSYLREDFMDDYTRLLNGEFESYTIDFIWPEGNTVTASKESLSGEKVTLTSEELMRSSTYDVYADNGTEVLRHITGSLLIYDDDYYYVDFKEIGYDVSEWYGFYPSDYKKLDAHKITDQALILNLAGAENRYYDDNLGFFYDDDFTEQISAVFIVFVFAVIPLAVCILFLILTFRSKAIYRKLYAAVTLISAAELAIFTILAVMINILPK